MNINRKARSKDIIPYIGKRFIYLWATSLATPFNFCFIIRPWNSLVLFFSSGFVNPGRSRDSLNIDIVTHRAAASGHAHRFLQNSFLSFSFSLFFIRRSASERSKEFLKRLNPEAKIQIRKKYTRARGGCKSSRLFIYRRNFLKKSLQLRFKIVLIQSQKWFEWSTYISFPYPHSSSNKCIERKKKKRKRKSISFIIL